MLLENGASEPYWESSIQTLSNKLPRHPGFKAVRIYLAHDCEGQHSSWAQKDHSSSLGWGHSCNHSQMLCEQGWSLPAMASKERAHLSPHTLSSSSSLSRLALKVAGSFPRGHRGVYEDSWGLGLKTEHLGCPGGSVSWVLAPVLISRLWVPVPCWVPGWVWSLA